MKTSIDRSRLDAITGSMLKNRHVFGAIFCLENEDGDLVYHGGAGEIAAHDRYLIASVTKLYVTAVLLMLKEDRKLAFTDPIQSFFPEGYLDKIHVHKGTDYSADITVAHLLSNTSGIPDYFYYGQGQGKAAGSLLEGLDEAWPLTRAIEGAKAGKPKFKPGQKGKVHYSDTNFRLLGGIIEKITGKDIKDVFQDLIFTPLDLKETYAFQDESDASMAPLYYNQERIQAPRYLASITAEGGIVSNGEECLKFLKAFFSGFFFPKERINELKQTWNMIYFPGQFYFGLGLEKLWVPRFMTGGRPVGEILGFWGQSGAFAFHHPRTGLYFSGTVNQLSGRGHGAAFKAILKAIKIVGESR